jgi:glycosyltransferase 2 family protein
MRLTAAPGRPSMRRAERAVLAGVVLFALGFAAAALLGGGRQAWLIVLHVPGRIIPVLLALSLVNYIMRGARWLLFSHALRLNVPAASNLLYYVSGFAMTTTPGKMGEIVRLYLLNRFHNCPYDRTAALLISDRLSDGLATTIVVALTIAAFAHLPAGAAGAIAFAAALVVVCLWPGILLLLVHAVFARLHRWPRLFVRARRAVRGLQLLADPPIFAAALVMGAIGWSSEGLSFYVLLHALGVALAPAACIFIFAFAMLVGAASILPGGLGSTEATMIGLLSLQGVPFETAIVATGVVRITTLWFAVSLGLLALPVALGGAGRVRAVRSLPVA